MLLNALFLGVLAAAAPIVQDDEIEARQVADLYALPGYTDAHYYATFDDIANGTVLSTYEGVSWSGFQTTTERDGVIPEDCPYFGPDRGTLCHYAYGARGQAKKPVNLPTISAAAPSTLIKLNYFSWAVGGPPFFGRGANLTVTGYFARKNGRLVDSGISADYFYAASQNVGGTGAGMVNVTLPAYFGEFAAVRFNLSATYDTTDEPYLLLDDVDLVAYTPI